AKLRYLQRCRAFIFPSEEDFGIAPVEAMAAGRPVVAYGAGGALDVVIEGQTGVFFREQTVDGLTEALAHVSSYRWNSTAISHHASTFDVEAFKLRLSRFVEECSEVHPRPRVLTGDKHADLVASQLTDIRN
ncbi:MAG TPA: glycosyltransferase, partial [Chloroflexota bacterium]|nr:glycosyltransferase [Chloroflexota bacterium]